MGKSTIVKYLIQGKRNGKWELILTSDTKPKLNAEFYRDNFNDSLTGNKANSHLGIKYRVSDARIINQITGKVIDEFKAPLFEII